MLYLIIGSIVVVVGIILFFIIRELASSAWMLSAQIESKKSAPTAEKRKVTYEELMDEDGLKDLQFKLMNIIKQKLVAPSTAVLCSPYDMIITEKGEKFLVTGYVDSQNSFGGMGRSSFRATCTYDPDAKFWWVEHVSVMDK